MIACPGSPEALVTRCRLTSFDKLIAEHDELEAAAQLLLLTANCREFDVDAVMAIRSKLAMDLADHLIKEDGLVYPHLLASSDASISNAAGTFITDFQDIASVWSGYVDYWTPANIMADVQGFRDMTHVVVKRLIDRIQRENDELYPLALRAGVLKLRAA